MNGRWRGGGCGQLRKENKTMNGADRGGEEEGHSVLDKYRVTGGWS